MKRGAVYIAGTFDTKGAELMYAAQRVRAAGAKAITVDVSTRRTETWASVSAERLAALHPDGADAIFAAGGRGKAIAEMQRALAMFLVMRDDLGAVLGLGGSGNTALVTGAMQALDFGVPKIMVSTVASGNVAAYVGGSDIMMMHSVADIAGLNHITKQVIGNAAHAAAGMALHRLQPKAPKRASAGLTMFGVTTPAVTAIRQALEPTHDCYVFHATGIGGQCFENLILSGVLGSAIDLTTTEVADYLFGGILPCTEDRFTSVIHCKTPYVGSVGAVDMVNFGPRASVPEQHRGRLLHEHNAAVTLMRTTPAENAAIGAWIVERLNKMRGPVRFMLPLRGVSALDSMGQPFFDPAADAALFAAIRDGWQSAGNRKLIEVDAHINDPAFANAVLAAFREIEHGKS